MHSFTFVPDSNRAPVPTHVKLGSGKTVMVRDAFAGAAADSVRWSLTHQRLEASDKPRFTGAQWQEQFLTRLDAAPQPVQLRFVPETRFGAPGGTPLRACAECPDEPDREHRGPFPVPAPDRFSERNWPEPNNRYWCSCAVCSLAYFGPKRSHICWSCTPEKGPSA